MLCVELIKAFGVSATVCIGATVVSDENS